MIRADKHNLIVVDLSFSTFLSDRLGKYQGLLPKCVQPHTHRFCLRRHERRLQEFAAPIGRHVDYVVMTSLSQEQPLSLSIMSQIYLFGYCIHSRISFYFCFHFLNRVYLDSFWLSRSVIFLLIFPSSVHISIHHSSFLFTFYLSVYLSIRHFSIFLHCRHTSHRNTTIKCLRYVRRIRICNGYYPMFSS